MSLLSRLLPISNVVLDLDVASKKRVFEHVGLLFENSLGVGRSLIFDALFARERMGSTGLGHGVAIPHGRIKGLKEAMGAFIRIKSPIPFEAPDGHPVNLIFVLLVPEKANDLHLQILGELAQLFSEREMRSALTSAPDAAAAQRLITEWEPHAPSQRRAAV
jgi:PTS system nitrogen regulatory IIA component